jgi:hypothetical protein
LCDQLRLIEVNPVRATFDNDMAGGERLVSTESIDRLVCAGQNHGR